jgi:hypothetical protein
LYSAAVEMRMLALRNQLSLVLLCTASCIDHRSILVESSVVFVDDDATVADNEHVAESVILYPNENLERGVFRSSPNGRYQAGLSETGDFVLLNADQNDHIWSAGISGGVRAHMQTDGNLVVRDASNKGIWSTNTHTYPASKLVIDDFGQVALKFGLDRLWFSGVPRSYYHYRVTPDELEFPVRGTFYYPWYPSTWTVGGHQSHYEPTLGWYSSSDPEIARAHIKSMEYAHIDLSIASWWGPDTKLDRARLTMLMDETVRRNSPLRWTVYYEIEMKQDPSLSKIQSDLDYLQAWFTKHPAWAYKNGKPVIFVYNDSSGCNVVNRWMKASKGEWYVVMKVVKDYEDCPIQPDSWHQYGTGSTPGKNGIVHNKGYSYVISPGFWHATSDTPKVPRLSPRDNCNNVKKMVESGEPWQLVLSFNEAGEGTLIESCTAWESRSGHGKYLDCLHDVESGGAPATRSLNLWPGFVLAIGVVVGSILL